MITKTMATTTQELGRVLSHNAVFLETCVRYLQRRGRYRANDVAL